MRPTGRSSSSVTRAKDERDALCPWTTTHEWRSRCASEPPTRSLPPRPPCTRLCQDRRPAGWRQPRRGHEPCPRRRIHRMTNIALENRLANPTCWYWVRLPSDASYHPRFHGKQQEMSMTWPRLATGKENRTPSINITYTSCRYPLMMISPVTISIQSSTTRTCGYPSTSEKEISETE